jgi:hypothetical protein
MVLDSHVEAQFDVTLYTVIHARASIGYDEDTIMATKLLQLSIFYCYTYGRPSHKTGLFPPTPSS